MVFSTNQARQLYVAKALVADGDELTNAGDIKVLSDADGNLYFGYKGADSVMRSDIIENVTYAKSTKASAMERKPKVATIAVTSVEKGKDYIVKINIRQFTGMSDEETYAVFGAAKAPSDTAADTAAIILDTLQKAVKNNGCISDLFEITGSGSNVVITEKPQPWKLGVMEQVPVYFDVELAPVDEFSVPSVSGAVTTYDWGTVTLSDGTPIPNSKTIADLEYFCMGERGDIYRNVGFPNVITTTYLVDPASTTGYNALDIHYAFQGSCEDIQKSEKDITIVAESAATLNSIIAKVNTILGTSIANV